MPDCTLDRHGRIYEDDINQLYVVGWHQFALYYWSKAIAENKIKLGALLIHIDYHADQLNDLASEYKNLASPNEILNLIETAKIRYDTYIVPAIRWKIINEIAFCCYIPKPDEYLGFINHDEILSLENWLQTSKINERDIILNIDLDYFFEPPNTRNEPSPPKCEDVIKSEIKSINRLFEFANLTTIATSPCCGDNESRKYIQKLFKKNFVSRISLDENRLSPPPLIL